MCLARYSEYRIAVVSSFLFFLALMGCARDVSVPPTPGTQDPGWASIIATHTSGTISRKGEMHVQFARDVIDEQRTDMDARESIRIVPEVVGKVRFVNRREIVIKPVHELLAGQSYRIEVLPKKLTAVPASLRPYVFTVQTIRPDFELRIDDVLVDSDGESLNVRGLVVTADQEDDQRVEKILAATLQSHSQLPVWEHHTAQGRHRFTFKKIKRESRPQSLLVSWNGSPIDAEQRGMREIVVPAKDEFKLNDISLADEGGTRFIRATFTAVLASDQDITGLVRVNVAGAAARDVTARVENNVLKVYLPEAIEGRVTVVIDGALRNRKGGKLGAPVQGAVEIAPPKPQVRFVGHGVILPETKRLSIPIEAVNASYVTITAFRVYDNNFFQFLQVNRLDGNQELQRVGRYLWRKRIRLTADGEADANVGGKWNRYSLDVTELFAKYPGGMLRLKLTLTPRDVSYRCADATKENTPELPVAEADAEDNTQADSSNWDYAEQYFGVNDGSSWSDRENPCKQAYYRFGANVRAERNFLSSNIGLLAKADRNGDWLIVATNLRTAQVVADAKITALNYQGQTLVVTRTDANGMAHLHADANLFALRADTEAQQAYLKVQAGLALPISHFDVGGEQIAAGIKGMLYGERGVWRPGDDIFLTFVLQDKEHTLPARHPVVLELFNPKGQLLQSTNAIQNIGGFYAFKLTTKDDAPTGDWLAKVSVGGTSFTRTLKIETVMPNRLKIELQPAGNSEQLESHLQASLSSQWLTGATAAGLKADVAVRLTPKVTRFARNADFLFDDPARNVASEPHTIFEGQLDSQGMAKIDTTLPPVNEAAGFLSASLTTRVFERSGAFSINRKVLDYSPYENYVGIRLPKGDVARGMLLTDVNHTVEIATLSPRGEPTSVEQVEVTLYKVGWRWWWDKSGDSLAQFITSQYSTVLQRDVIATKNGAGTWQFLVRYPEWGRYFVRACDKQGGHCTGQIIYIDWPSWAGRAQEQSGPAASMLTLLADKDKYTVGETAHIKLPEAAQGRALLTIESGSKILEARWLQLGKDQKPVSVKITAAMAPNVYASVTLIQPHEDKTNDRPIRLYGVIPLLVTDPQTHINPVIRSADEWKPNSTATVTVSETQGHEMTYTLAVVDEGLLGLTSFKTPNLHEHFYKRESLGVSTWDLFDDVAGAYGAELERLLALGGSDGANKTDREQRKSRFTPVVTFLGPFNLAAKANAKHEIKLPQYVGAVRVMVVAGNNGAYGSSEKSVYVRQPLMILPTVPRVLGPEEDVFIPVSVFAMDESVKDVDVTLTTDDRIQVTSGNTVHLTFTRPEESLAMLSVHVRATVGKTQLKFVATSGSHRAESIINVEVRSPNPPITLQQTKAIAPGETWSTRIEPHGLSGTNKTTLEVSALPPIALERRLDYLITYPYGCVEQTTSSVFPQIYLPKLIKLEPQRRESIERNVRAGIDRLRGFQHANGGFTYWPGGFLVGSSFDARMAWSTTYVGHFLVEAEKQGYFVPQAMLTDWAKYQKEMASSWISGSEYSTFEQAYRLYTLALAQQPDVGAMNRLRADTSLNAVTRWTLAATYQLAGMPEAASELTAKLSLVSSAINASDAPFATPLRDRAFTLQMALIMNRNSLVQPLAKDIAADLNGSNWLSTQEVAYSLMAIARMAGGSVVDGFTFEQTIDSNRVLTAADAPIVNRALTEVGDKVTPVAIKNTSDKTLYVNVSTRGVPRPNTVKADAAALAIAIDYRDEAGQVVDITKLKQGTDVFAAVTITNSLARSINNIALTQMLPAGWEIHNDRMDGAEMQGAREGAAEHRYWWWLPDGSAEATAARVEYVDIRDDRLLRYFSLKAHESIRFIVRINAAYRGHFYLPSVSAEAMYDASQYARTAGDWVKVMDK